MDKLFQLHNQSVKWLAFESGTSDFKLLLYALCGIAVIALIIAAYAIDRHLSKPYPFKRKKK
jgi:hypothetical protein